MAKVSKKSSTRKYYTMEEVKKLTVEKSKAWNFKDMEGKIFGKLTVIGFAGVVKKSSKWFCLCSCGNITLSNSSSLNKGAKSCGCYQLMRATTHGESYSRSYSIWSGMIYRTTNKDNKDAANYVNRGIGVCKSWLVFSNFIRDMGHPPKGMTLERTNNEKGYSKENCIWADKKTQANNRRSNVFIEYNGLRLTVSQWSERTKINRSTIAIRLKMKLPLEDVFRPVIKKMIKYNGEELSILGWSRKLGINRSTIKGRLSRGLPINEILKTK